MLSRAVCILIENGGEEAWTGRNAKHDTETARQERVYLIKGINVVVAQSGSKGPGKGFGLCNFRLQVASMRGSPLFPSVWRAQRSNALSVHIE